MEWKRRCVGPGGRGNVDNEENGKSQGSLTDRARKARIKKRWMKRTVIYGQAGLKFENNRREFGVWHASGMSFRAFNFSVRCAWLWWLRAPMAQVWSLRARMIRILG